LPRVRTVAYPLAVRSFLHAFRHIVLTSPVAALCHARQCRRGQEGSTHPIPGSGLLQELPWPHSRYSVYLLVERMSHRSLSLCLSLSICLLFCLTWLHFLFVERVPPVFIDGLYCATLAHVVRRLRLVLRAQGFCHYSRVPSGRTYSSRQRQTSEFSFLWTPPVGSTRHATFMP
jgi:hypothetical protein